MPTLQEILRDPNYINANPATKQAIFERWAPQDTNFTSANGATQAAIRQRFGVGGVEQPMPEAPKDEGFFSNIGKLAYEGGERAIGAAKVSPSVISGNVGPEQAETISGQLSMKPSVQPKELTEVTGAFKDEAQAWEKAKGFTESVGPALGFMAEFGKQALTNPKGVAYMTAQSAAQMAPSIAGMIAGGKAGAIGGGAVAGPYGAAVGGVGGAIAGGFAGQAPMEIGSEFIDRVGDELRSRNLDPTKENVQALLADKAFVDRATQEARTKGATTAAVDSLMTAGAGRYATGPRRAAIKAAQNELGAAAEAATVAKRAEEILKEGTRMERAGRAVKRGAGAVGIDVAGGGLSEAAGQYAAYGKVDPESVMLEMLGELGGSAVEVPGAAYATGKDALKAQAKKQAEKILEQERALKGEEAAPPLKKAVQEEPSLDIEDLERAAGMTSVREEPKTVEDLIAQETTTKAPEAPTVAAPALQTTATAEAPAATEYVSPLESIKAREQKPEEPAAPAVEETPQEKFDRLSGMVGRMSNAFRDGVITNREFETYQAELEAARQAVKGASVDVSQLSAAKQEVLDLADKIEAAGNKAFAEGMRLNARPESKEPTAQVLEFYRSKLPTAKEEKAAETAAQEAVAYGLPEFFADTPKDADRISGLRKSGPNKVRIALDEINDTIQNLADTIAAAGYRMDQVIPGQVPPAILRIKSQIGTLAAGANRLASSAEAVQKGYKRADPKRVKSDIEAALADIAKAEDLISVQPNVPTAAEQMEGIAVPPTPEVQGLQEEQRKAEEDIKRLKSRGMSLWTALAGRLTGEEVRGLGGRNMKVGKNQFLNLAAKKGKPTAELSDLVSDGSLDAFLPPDMRHDSARFDEKDSTEYIREKLASGNYTTHETQMAVETIGQEVLDIERRIQEELSLEDINREIQVASDEQREADQAAADFAAESETGAVAERKAEEATELDDLEKRAADAGIDVDTIREQAYYDTRGEEDAMYERTLADRLRGALDAQEQFLAIQTEKDLKAQEELRKAKEKAEQERKRADEEKAKADEAAADFVLTGSDRAADQAAARGQMELAPAEEEVPRGEEVLSAQNEQARNDYYAASKEGDDVAKYKFSRYLDAANNSGSPVNVWSIDGELRPMAWNVEPPKYARLITTVHPEQTLKMAEKNQVGYSIDPEEQRVEKELTGKTMVQAADWAVNNAPNAFLKVIAEKVRNRLRDLERRGVKLEFEVVGGDRRPRSLYDSRGYMQPTWGDGTKGTTLRLVLNGAAVMNNQAGYPPGTRYSTVLHELLHVATRGYLQFAPLSDPLRRQMRDLTNAIVDRFNTDAKAGKLPPVMQKYYKRLNNVLESDDEVLAWGLTDEDVQKYYADIKVGEKSAMTRLVEMVRSVLGLGKPYESALDRLVKVSESMLDMDISTIDEILGNAGKRLGETKATTGEQQALFQKEGGGSGAEMFDQKEIEKNRTTEYKSRTKLIELPIDDFLALSDDGTAEYKTEGVQKLVSEGKKFSSLPFLIIDRDGRVEGHEGRHRARALKQAGYTTMPVILRSANIRWSEQSDADRFDYVEDWPTKMQAQKDAANPNFSIDFPVTREEAASDYQGDSPNILRQQEGRPNILGEPTLGNWTLEPDTKMDTKDSIIYKLMDKNIDMKRVVSAITQQVGEIANRWNPYLKEELYHGRTAKQTQDFLSKEVKPLIKEMNDAGVTIGEFEQYLHNRHAEAYNKHVAKVNPNRPEMQDGGSGIATEDARKYLADLPADKKKVYEDLANRIDAITKGTRELLVQSGLEKQETIDAWEKTFPDYVPLMREEGDFNYTTGSFGVGRGFDVRGSFSKRAMGSKRNVVDILANTVLARENAIVKSEKNRVAQAVYGLAVQNGSPDFWMAVNPMAEKVPQEAIDELVAMNIDPEAIQFLMKEPRQRAVDPKKNEVISRINATLRNNDNVLSMRFNGENRYVFFNPNNDRAKRAATALKNLDAQQLGAVMGMISKVTRYISSVNTQFNPIFGAYNFLRDVQGAALQLSTTPIAGKQKEVLKGSLPAMKAIYQSLRGKGADTEMTRLWEDFQQAGGQTGFRDMYSRSQDRTEALMDEFKKMSEGKLKTLGRNGLQLLSDYNDTMENAVRLSAYKVALESGYSRDEAASIAKNLTVNFNRKGAIATQAGALYAFFNASMQGTARLYETLKGPAGKKILAGGLLWGAMQSVLLALAGFDEDEPPEFVRERNFIIPIGNKKYLAFPMPLGYHVIPGTSRMVTDTVLAAAGVLKSKKNTAERVADLTGMYLEAFNPIGNAGWSIQTVAPTFLDPFVALAENKDWTGKPIAKKDFNSMDPTPGYTRAKDTASWFSTKLAEFLNFASGGTKYQPGYVSPTPDQIDYLIGQATGGVGREALKVATTAEKLYTGEELPPYKIPVVGRFYGEATSSAAEAGRFYKNLEHLNKLDNEIKGRKEHKEALGTFVADNPEARLIKRAHQTYTEIKKLRDRKEKLVERGASRESVKAVENQITLKMKTINDQIERAQK